MYLVDFDNSLTNFTWSKVPIGCTGPRAYHSCTFVPNLDSIAIVGGITSHKDGTCVRQKLAVTLVNTSNWTWNEIIVSNDIYLSSTKMLLAGSNTLVYFGGYTSQLPSRKQEENSKTSYWGTVKLHKQSSQQLQVEWRGKGSELGSYACAQAVKVGNDILLSCGTEQKWAVCTSVKPTLELCDIPQCVANTGLGAVAGFGMWIRCFTHFTYNDVTTNNYMLPNIHILPPQMRVKL